MLSLQAKRSRDSSFHIILAYQVKSKMAENNLLNFEMKYVENKEELFQLRQETISLPMSDQILLRVQHSQSEPNMTMQSEPTIQIREALFMLGLDNLPCKLLQIL